MYIGVSGKSRKVKRGYIGVSGKARMFYTASTTWNRYTIGKKYTHNIYSTGGGSNPGTAHTHYNELYYCYYSDLNNLSIYDYVKHYEDRDYVYPYFDVRESYFTYLKYADNRLDEGLTENELNNLLRGKLIATSNAVIPYDYATSELLLCTDVIGGWGKYESGYFGQISILGRYDYYLEVTGSTDIQGDFIDTIESEDENAYPDNGISGDYWYVKVN